MKLYVWIIDEVRMCNALCGMNTFIIMQVIVSDRLLLIAQSHKNMIGYNVVLDHPKSIETWYNMV